MTFALVIIFVMMLALCALLNLATLPGNWIMAVLVLLWFFFGPEPPSPMGFFFFATFFGLAVAGEVVEFVAQIWGAKKYGASGRATIFGIIGAIAGAVLGAPLFFGLGAVLGALGGAWLGSFLSERLLSDKGVSEAVTAANGALLGRFLGMTVKFGLGITMIVLTATTIWPA